MTFAVKGVFTPLLHFSPNSQMISPQNWIQAGALAALLVAPSFAQGDDCTTALAVAGTGNWAFDTTAATTTGFSGGSACTNAGSLDVGPDQFFQWTADAAGSWQIDTCGSNYDTKLNAHSGTACAATCTAYNDDGPCGSFHSTLTLTGVAIGDTFLIQVGGWNGNAGVGVLNTALLAGASSNEDCSIPDVVAGVGAWAFNSLGASVSGFTGGSACTAAGSLAMNSDLFWEWTADAAGSWQIDTFGSSFDTMLSVHTGSGCTATCTYFNDQSGGNQSSVIVGGVSIGDTFLIQVGGWNGAAGLGGLNTTALGAGPGNDDCSVADVIGGLGTWSFNTVIASTSGFSGGSACTNAGSLDFGPDLFWQWTATTTGDIEIKLEGSLYDTKLNVHTGTGCAATCLAYNDDSYGLQSAVTLSGVNAGDTFLIQIGGFAGQSGTGTMEILPWVDPCIALGDDAFEDNDTTATATALTSGVYPGLICHQTDSDFYVFTIPPAEILTLDIIWFLDDLDMSEYDGAGNWVSDIDANGMTHSNTSGAVETWIVEIRDDPAFGGDCSDYDMTVTIAPDPCASVLPDPFEENDSCATATSIGDGAYIALNTSKTDPDYYSLTVADGVTVTIDVNHSAALGDLDAMLWEAAFCDDDQASACNNTLACGFSGSDNENLTWTNTTGADMDCTLRVHVWPNSGSDCNDYDLIIVGAGAAGPALFCNPANTHSGGGSATLGGSDFSGPGVFHLDAQGGPVDQFGYFLVSAAPVDPGISVADGELCLTAPIGRYNPGAGPALNSIGRFDAGGVFQNLGGTSTVGSGFDLPATLPSPPGGVITVGATWHFQLWFRDGASSNFSDGISVDF